MPGSDRWFYGHASRIVVMGRKVKELVVTRGGFDAANIRVILHGNYHHFLKFAGPAEEVGPTVLFFGRIYEYKGLEYLIDAEPLVSAELPDVRFVIAGAGSRRYLDRIRKRMVHADRFRMTGRYVTDGDAARLFQESSLVVLPYVDGTQSGPLLLAYAFRKPVVVTRVGSLPEYVIEGETGCVVPPGDAAALAAGILELLRDRAARVAMGEAGHRFSSRELDWSRQAAQYLEVYREAAGKGR